MPASKVAELVEEEAARAEAESPDEEKESEEGAEQPSEPEPAEPSTETEPEPEPSEPEPSEPEPSEPEPEAPPTLPGALSEEDVERKNKALENEATRHANRVASIMEEDVAALEPCPRCLPKIPGFYYPGAPVEQEQRFAVKLSIGEAAIPDPKSDPYSHECSTCEGWGKVMTGSKVAGAQTLSCADCGGKGYQASGKRLEAPAARGPMLAAVADGTTLTPVSEEPAMDVDPWGTPAGAPYFGVLTNLRPPGWEQEVEAWKAARV
jgi:hypothetical protein